MRSHLRIDGKAVRGAARGGARPMLLSGIWDDGTTAAQLPVDAKKTNEIPVFRQLLGKIPRGPGRGDYRGPDAHPAQARPADRAAGAFFIFTIGENQPNLFDAADALPWGSFAGEAWTVDRGHGRIDVRTIKTCRPRRGSPALFPDVRQVFLVERYSYGTDGNLLGAVAVLGITSLPAGQAGPADLLAYLRGHGPSKCTIMSVTSLRGGRQPGPPPRTGPWPPSATPSPASFHLHQVPNIAAQLRANHRDPYQPPAAAPRPRSPVPVTRLTPRREPGDTKPARPPAAGITATPQPAET